MPPVPAAALPYLAAAAADAMIAPVFVRAWRVRGMWQSARRLSRTGRRLLTAACEVFAVSCACQGLQVWLGADTLGGLARLIVGVAPVAFVALVVAIWVGCVGGWALEDATSPARDDMPPV